MALHLRTLQHLGPFYTGGHTGSFGILTEALQMQTLPGSQPASAKPSLRRCGLCITDNSWCGCDWRCSTLLIQSHQSHTSHVMLPLLNIISSFKGLWKHCVSQKITIKSQQCVSAIAACIGS